MNQPTAGELVKSSWLAATRSPVVFGKSFYARLFWVSPEMRGMFTGDLTGQEHKLTETLTHVVNHAERLGTAMPVVRELARRHAEYGVQPEHYDTIGEVLIWTLEHSLGPRFTAAEKAAWEQTYQRIAKAMIEAAYPEG